MFRPLLFLAAATLLSGCTAARVALPSGFAAASVQNVSGISPRRSGQPVAFGPYTARMLDDGATFSWAVPVGVADVGRTSRRYAYTLTAPGAPTVEVACLNRAWTLGRGGDQRLTVDVTGIAGPLLACEARAADRPTARIDVSRRGRDLSGEVAIAGAAPLRVRSTAALQGSAISLDRPAGYVVEDATRTWMVVDALGAGQVHLAANADPARDAWLAATATALLLMDPELE